MNTDLKIFERIKDNPPGKRGIRRTEIWDREVTAVLPASWIHTDRPGDRTVVLAEVCKAVTKSWFEDTPDGFVEQHLRVPCRHQRRLKLVTLSAANEVTGVDYVSGQGYSLPDFWAVCEAGAVSDGKPQERLLVMAPQWIRECRARLDR
jgi:hypothetical protein